VSCGGPSCQEACTRPPATGQNYWHVGGQQMGGGSGGSRGHEAAWRQGYGQEGEAIWRRVAYVPPLRWGKRWTCADACLGRCKSRLNLRRVCVSTDRPAKMRRAVRLGFSTPGRKRTETDERCGRWRCSNNLYCHASAMKTAPPKPKYSLIFKICCV
jgi:hypothetical protein